MTIATSSVSEDVYAALGLKDVTIEEFDVEGVGCGLFLITPEMAEVWLGQNKSNRGLSKTRGGHLADSFLRGEWDLNGETIKIDWDANMIDGQHRAWAIRKANIAVPSFVVWGLDPNVRLSIDLTRAKNLRDALGMIGIPQPSNIAAALQALYSFEHKEYHFTTSKHKLTPKSGTEYYYEHPSIHDSVRVAGRMNSTSLSAPGAIVALSHYLFSSLEEEGNDDTEFFFERLYKGGYLDDDDPIHHLRERLIKNSEAKDPLTRRDASALINKAWNMFRRGEVVKDTLSVRLGGSRPEKFPIPE